MKLEEPRNLKEPRHLKEPRDIKESRDNKEPWDNDDLRAMKFLGMTIEILWVVQIPGTIKSLGSYKLSLGCHKMFWSLLWEFCSRK